ncbi:MAG: fibronectin type III domain-containing protein [Ruminococcus sp.]|nr:fibronectin type III domain-containing protein [Ruminococcus sp.]
MKLRNRIIALAMAASTCVGLFAYAASFLKFSPNVISVDAMEIVDSVDLDKLDSESETIIFKSSIAKAVITLEDYSYDYTGKPVYPKIVSVRRSPTAIKDLTENVHYTVSYENNVNPGTGYVVITGIGYCEGTVKKPFTINPPGPLTAVTGFKVSSTNASNVKLSWDKAAGAQGYILYQYKSNKWVRIAKPTTNTYTVSGLSPATNYKFAVKPYMMAGTVEVTSKTYPTVLTTTTPATITKATFTSSANAVKMAWSKVSGAVGYRVYQYNTSTKKWVGIANTSSTSYTFKNLKAGTSYKFTVRAYNKFNNKSVLSAKYTTFSTSTNPAKVSFTVTPAKGKATLKWTKVAGATSYKVYYKTSSTGKWVALKTTNNTTTSYTKTHLTSGKTYYFTVKAVRTTGGKTYNGAYTTKAAKIK